MPGRMVETRARACPRKLILHFALYSSSASSLLTTHALISSPNRHMGHGLGESLWQEEGDRDDDSGARRLLLVSRTHVLVHLRLLCKQQGQSTQVELAWSPIPPLFSAESWRVACSSRWPSRLPHPLIALLLSSTYAPRTGLSPSFRHHPQLYTDTMPIPAAEEKKK